ncbi:dihydrofolate reductase family protein [Streptomyces litchfieldiae]|uniref:Dihydrofolate reductase family protein n=1 Tax=Streptomyces litchfieldiae TaxID=3075543 RepID=A0ABU2MQH9_9ACTN|nr:dihydrofolate reductase family protein [Streptomyces sp. DSM 44938]MDT0343881.1 dihydrofolate reductase family protein [Streptomyces sp. DSM 44938]
MAKVLYSMMSSLDGYIEDANGDIGFSAPDQEVHRMANEQTRQAAAFLFGRGLYEAMEEPWTSAARQEDLPEVEAEFARLYLRTPRIVFSDTLESVPEGVRLVRRADAVAEVRRLKEETEGELHLGGAQLAASLLDLIDEFRLFVMPVAVGGGKPFLPRGRELELALTEYRVFASGTLYLRYERRGAVTGTSGPVPV